MLADTTFNSGELRDHDLFMKWFETHFLETTSARHQRVACLTRELDSMGPSPEFELNSAARADRGGNSQSQGKKGFAAGSRILRDTSPRSERIYRRVFDTSCHRFSQMPACDVAILSSRQTWGHAAGVLVLKLWKAMMARICHLTRGLFGPLIQMK